MEQLNPHISDKDLKLFHANKLSAEEIEALLSHTARCTFCADRLAGSFEDAGLYKAPKNFKEAVLAKAEAQPHMPALTSFSRRQQWFFYSAKICAATGLALLTLFALPNMNFEEATAPPAFSKQNPSFTEKLNTSLNTAAASVNEQMNLFITYNPIKEEH